MKKFCVAWNNKNVTKVQKKSAKTVKNIFEVIVSVKKLFIPGKI